MPEDLCVEFILQSRPDDPRQVKWEYDLILNTLQDIEESDLTNLLKEINTRHKKTHKCDKDLFSYSSLYGIVGTLSSNNILDVKNKIYSVNSKYTTTRLKYMPVSHYFVGVFGISVIFLLYTLYSQTMIQMSLSSVIVIAICMISQMLGEEFNFNGFKNKK